ncbi:MAG: tail fiber domain-containing protein [Verrucomicrobia bacterium]|nr:tail fiber domain-containing protein [Verrucomicrobiota bacterium]
MRLSSGGLRVNGTFVSASDRDQKENFSAVSPREVLEKVASLPISEWNYKDDPASRHVGPMAQDFHAAFGVGPDEKHIATVDADGVALAAIQGLNQKVEEQAAALRAREARIARLEAELVELRNLLVQAVNSGNPTRQ